MNKSDIKQTYYLGLDIGTNSVGWAVTDESYNLCKFKKKDMWGIRLFESAQTAEDRRIQRNARRRLQRQHQRIDLLQELFAEEIAKIDDTFFIRLNESRLHLGDKTQKFKHPLFNDDDYTDIDYHKEYPTIYHLRKELIENNKGKYDIRLVYLALHHILKHRGHFLIDGDVKAAKSFDVTFEKLCNGIIDNTGITFEINDKSAFEELLRTKEIAKSTRATRLTNLFDFDEEDKTKEEIAQQKKAVKAICSLLVGNKGEFANIVGEDLSDIESTSCKLSEQASEDVRNALASTHPDVAALFDAIKAMYDWSILVEILGGEEYFSFAKVKEYETHKANLNSIRRIIRKYCDKKTYKEFFENQNGKDNYVNYIGHVKKNGKKYASKESKNAGLEDAFYKKLGKILSEIKVSDKDDQDELDRLIQGCSDKNLLPLQRSKNNSTVPKQIHEEELKRILHNAQDYLPFLSKTEDGLSVADKIVEIFRFRVPYYVGPLSGKNSKNFWMVRQEGKEKEKIYPWNWRQIIDEEASNEAFIRRMTNKCTYILEEDVIPKNSILYSKYMVLNELNNLKIRQRKPSEKVKQNIFNDLFLTKTRVTGKQLLTYLQINLPDADLEIQDLSGFDKDFKSNMNSYLDFKKKIYGDAFTADKLDIAENIIRWITIYDSDPKMIKRIINTNYPGEFTEDQLKQICRFRYSGWGNFSEMFLNGVEGISKETGEQGTIIDALWNTNCNLMQLLSSEFTFTQEIKKINDGRTKEVKGFTYESLVADLYVSPANKRAIWQTLQIVKEITKVMGHAPQKIFVEMARSDEEKGDAGRKASRKDKLLQLYKNCEEDVREWSEEIEQTDERKFSSKKLYLYYTQKGRCMYTDERIDLDELMQSNSKWDIDHIYPQSKVMDDSLDNLVLVKKKANEEKSNAVISPDIQRKMKPFWEQLLKEGFISKKKYERLTKRGDFTDEELSGFLARQLVETRQSSKAVAELLGSLFPESRIVYVKANLVSRFRNRELMELKSRRINDFHHAKDAYLNVVVGNVYDSKYTSDPIRWIKENRDTEYSLNMTFYRDVVNKGQKVWIAPDYDKQTKKVKRNEKGGAVGGSIDTVRATMHKNNVLYTEYSYCSKGKLFDIQPKSAKDNATIPLKGGLDVSRYGGYKSANNAYFALIEFDGKKGERVRNIIGVPIYIANMLEYRPEAFIDYCEETKGLKNVRVIYGQIKKNALLLVDGYPLRIKNDNEKNVGFKQNMQLLLDEKTEESTRRIEKYLEKRASNQVSPKYDGFDEKDADAVYDELICKLKTVYAKRPANQANTLENGRVLFKQLCLAKKAYVIGEILKMMGCGDESKANLTLIGGNSQAGNIAKNKNTVGKAKLVLVNQSVTGLFENRIEL